MVVTIFFSVKAKELKSEAYLEPSRTSVMEIFCKNKSGKSR